MSHSGEVALYGFTLDCELGVDVEHAHAIEAALDGYIFANGEQSLEEIVGMYLMMKQATIAVAESCTGGLVAERLTNVPGFLHSAGLEVECPGIGAIKVDVAYGGNFYAIVEPQEGYRDMADFTAGPGDEDDGFTHSFPPSGRPAVLRRPPSP